jgi:quercetin dioxygenase-like cupin family protein
MPTDSPSIPPAQELPLAGLVTPTVQGIASRVLARTTGGNLTLFAFDAGQGLEEHTSPFDALVLVLEGALTLTIGGESVRATPGTIVRMPGGVPHALDARERTRMLLVMLRDRQAPGERAAGRPRRARRRAQ